MSGARIVDVAVALPEAIERAEDLAQAHPEWNVAEALKHTGVLERHVAAPGQTALDLGVAAARQVLDRNPEIAAQIDLLVSCTQTPDHRIPGNATILHGRLGLPSTVGAFDLGLACSGFTAALALVHGLMRGGACRAALVVNADTYTRLVSPRDRGTRLLFGDGAAATLLAPAAEGAGVLDVSWGTDGAQFQAFHVPAGGMRSPERDDDPYVVDGPNERRPGHIHMNGKAMVAFTYGVIPGHVRALLARVGLEVADVHHFFFHQASSLVLDGLRSRLRVPPERWHSNLARRGNTVSASIPLLLHDVLAEGGVKPGELALLCGFGAGLSWCSALVRF